MYDDYYEDEEEEEEVSAPAIIPQNQPPVEELEEGKIINAFSKAFFFSNEIILLLYRI